MKHGNLLNYVHRAIQCIDYDGKQCSISGENIDKFSMLTQIILNNMNVLEIDRKKMAISKNLFLREFNNVFYQMKINKTPNESFDSCIDNFKKTLRKYQLKKYTISFPLNITFSSSDYPSSFRIFDVRIDRISSYEWKNKFVEPALQDWALQYYMNKVENKLDNFHDTYWQVEMCSVDSDFSIEKLEEYLEVLLGEINYIKNYGRVSRGRSSIIPNSRLSDLRIPFIFLVLENDKYSTWYCSEDISERERVSLIGINFTDFLDFLDEMPKFETRSDINTTLSGAFRLYQSGIASNNKNESFLYFWRCLEVLTLKENQQKSDDVVKRVLAVISPKESDLIEELFPSLINKRNLMVHKDIEVTISEMERHFLKHFVERLLHVYLSFYKEFDYKDFLFLLTNGGKNKCQLEQLKKEKIRQADLIDMIKDLK